MSVIEVTVIDEVSVIEVTVIKPTAGKRGTTMDATGKTTHTTTHATLGHRPCRPYGHRRRHEPAPTASTDRRYSADTGGTHNILEVRRAC